MSYDYTKQDLKSLYNFLKENPKASFKSWEKHYSKTLSKEERSLFKNIHYYDIKVPVKDNEYIFTLLLWRNGYGGDGWAPMDKFAVKYFKSWYEFDLSINSNYRESKLITLDKEFFESVHDWDEGRITGTKQLSFTIGECEILFISDYNLDDDDELAIESYSGWMSGLSREWCHYYLGSQYNMYIKNMGSLKFKPVIGLFDK